MRSRPQRPIPIPDATPQIVYRWDRVLGARDMHEASVGPRPGGPSAVSDRDLGLPGPLSMGNGDV